MKNWKSFLLRLPIYVLIVALIGVGVWQLLKNSQPPEILDGVLPSGDSQVPTGDTIVQSDDIKLMPKNVIQFGDSFEYSPPASDGHLLCTVTDARLVTNQSECPPASWFDPTSTALTSSDNTTYYFDEWFIKGGAFDKNCRIVVVDLTVTNVDAKSWPNNGLFDGSSGYFNDPYLFTATRILCMADLGKVIYGIGDPRYQITAWSCGFSRYCEYSDDIRGTIGYEADAVRIAPGETISYSLVFPILGARFENEHGTLRDFSALMLCPSASTNPETDVFIDLKLGE